MSDTYSTAALALHKAFQQVAPDVRPGLTYDEWACLPEDERRLAVRAVWQASQSWDFLAGVLEEADLERVAKALARETVIRSVMAESGEPREIVAEMVDASASMDQEAVLDLTEGEPTTLRDALERYVENVRQNGVPAGAEYDLEALLAYPYPDGGSAATDALVDALDASGGFPVPTPREFARRVEHQLQARGYRVGKR